MNVRQCLRRPVKSSRRGRREKYRRRLLGLAAAQDAQCDGSGSTRSRPRHLHNKEQSLASPSGHRVHPSLSTGTGTGQLYFVKSHAKAHSNSQTSHPNGTLCAGRFFVFLIVKALCSRLLREKQSHTSTVKSGASISHLQLTLCNTFRKRSPCCSGF